MTDRIGASIKGPSLGSLSALTVFLVLLTVSVGFACSLIGQMSLDTPSDFRIWSWSIWTDQIWILRITRLAAAALVGAALATAGMALQALLRNPLAEPYILGISSGAGVGVLLGSALTGV